MPASAWFDYYNRLRSLPPLSWSVLNPPSKGILLKPRLYPVSPLLPPSLPPSEPPCLSTHSEWKQKLCYFRGAGDLALPALLKLLPPLCPCSLCPSHPWKLQVHSCPGAFACVIPILPPPPSPNSSFSHSLPLSPSSSPCSAISPSQGLLPDNCPSSHPSHLPSLLCYAPSKDHLTHCRNYLFCLFVCLLS